MSEPAVPSSAPAAPSVNPAGSGRWLDFSLLVLLGVWIFLLRSQGPSNLTDNDQERPASYVLDAVANGHWVVQRDWKGAITSKPPAYTWLAGAASVVWGRVTVTTLYLTCGLAILGAALLMHGWASWVFGARVGWLTGVFLLANPLMAKLTALARTDALFTFGVTLTAVLVARAWERGRGWIWAWLAAAFATLTKGPLGLLLGAAGLVAWFWERRRGARVPVSRDHVWGLLAYLFLVGGWFVWAHAEAGGALVDKMLKAELLEHAVTTTHGVPGAGLVLAPGYFLTRFMPWSVLAVAGILGVFRWPLADSLARRSQRFAAAWLGGGLLLLALGSHQRGDLVAPLVPAGAVLAAVFAERWVRRWPVGWVRWGGAAGALGLTLLFQAQHLQGSRKVLAESAGVEDLARRYAASGRDPRRLLHTDAPYALQFHLQTMQFSRRPEEAARLLRVGAAEFVAVRDREALDRALAAEGWRSVDVLAWPTSGVAKVQIVSAASSPSK